MLLSLFTRVVDSTRHGASGSALLPAPLLAIAVGLGSACGSQPDHGPWLVARGDARLDAQTRRVSTGNVSRPDGTGVEVALPAELPAGARVEWELGPPVPGVPDPTLVHVRDGEETVLVGQPLPADQPGAHAWRRFRAELTGLALPATLAYAKADAGPLRSLPRVLGRRDGTPRPSVVWIVLDTVRADYLGSYGHDCPTSPRIDALAERSLLFERAISPASWTLPAMASMLTGLYGEGHGVVHTEHRLDGQYASFVEVLARAGYATGAVVSGTFTDSLWGLDQGFDEYDDLGMVVDDHEGGEATIAAMKQRAHRRVTSPEVTERALAFLERNAGGRFFLLAHYFDPHQDFVEHTGFSERFGPRPAPSPGLGRHDPDPDATARLRGLYEGEIAFTDHHVGRLLERLEAQPFAGEVVVVITSDHGEEFYERQWLGHGNSLFNELVHVPLILHVPGMDGRRVPAPVTTLDLAPTLLELCGLPADFGQGRSLAGLFEPQADRKARPVYASLFATPAPAVGVTGAQFGVRVDVGTETALSDQRYAQAGVLLYDWNADPLQERNLGQRLPGRAQALLGLYERERSRLVELQVSPQLLELSDEVLEALGGLGYTGGDGR